MAIKITIGILSLLFASIPFLKEFFSGNSRPSRTYVVSITTLIAVIIVLTIVDIKITNDDAQQSKNQITQLQNNIDTIKQSLLPFGLSLTNNKVSPIQNSISGISKNTANINSGHIGDNYNNQTTVEKFETINNIKNQPAVKEEKNDEEVLKLVQPPILLKKEGRSFVKYVIQTKEKLEATNLDDVCIVLTKSDNKIERICENRFIKGFGVITNYPKELLYNVDCLTFPSTKNYFIVLRVCYNDISQREKKFKIAHKITSNGKAIPVTDKEYSEIVEYLVNDVDYNCGSRV